MFGSVLVPLDGTRLSERALPLARMVGGTPGTRLHLVSVEEPDSDVPDRESYLAEIMESLRAEDIDADHDVLHGKVVDAIDERARRIGADLIVMATHGRRGLQRLRFGSVAEGLVSRGVAPMLLFHPGPDDSSSAQPAIDRVVVPLDQSAFSQSILDPLEHLGKAIGVSSYTLVHVADGKGAGKPGWTPLSTVLTRANERMAPVRERFAGVDVDVKVIMASDPSEGILGVAEETGADLIAMTTHGMTGARPTLFGSVAAAVLHEWNGPLLVQRPAWD